ncbi:hypothetical protein CGRA01v4_08058 [Colletotrichum graminicola]|nr:hypothetical protein CGRA01v4_08058 [Colletotrichum graminicola]
MAWHGMAWRGVAWTRILRCSGRDQKKVVSGGMGMASPPEQTNPHSLRCDACNTFPRCECGYGMRLGVDLDRTGHRPNHPSVRLLAPRRGGGVVIR